ncbi:MAG: hypothetical protein ABIY55_22995 [Kofleriaceae bacterium]
MEAIDMLSRLKERLPVLLALIKELERIAAGGRRVPARNTLVLQMAHDSFDMLVIDLNSLRERMLSGDLFADRSGLAGSRELRFNTTLPL